MVINIPANEPLPATPAHAKNSRTGLRLHIPANGHILWGVPLEMTVLEPLRCPGCSTRFHLTLARVRPGLRRAQCFRCDTVFPIEAQVTRLLASGPRLEAPGTGTPPAVPEPMPSLTLEDLQGAQDDILDVPVVAEADDIQGEAPAGPDGEGSHGGGFASAKDAIEKLMGKAPAPPPPPSARMGSRSTMDVEATLDALETTLGGPSHPPPSTAPEDARHRPEPAPEPAPVPAPEPAPRKPDLASTVKLSSEEIREAMAGLDGRNRADLAPVTPPATVIRPVDQPAEVQPPELLKVQLAQETCNNVSLEQMAAWIEQGRVQEYHLVARQFSEHWIEACKVPALRPVFDRMRKVHSAPADAFSAPEPPPVKRGLFSGLFGRN
jgi:hypothetical protein